MAPLDKPAPELDAPSEAWLRANGIDPARVPHADAGTWEGFQLKAKELWDLGLREDAFVDALAGGRDPEGVILRTPSAEAIDAYFEREEACARST